MELWRKYTLVINEENEGEYTANYAKEYNIDIQSGNLTVAIEGNKTNAIAGEEISFTITLNENYRLANVSINNGNVTYTMQDNTYSFTMPAENVTIDVTYSQLFDISVTSEHGSVTITDNKTEGIAGESISFTITPEENYRLANVSINNGSVTYTTQDNAYSFTMPAGDVEITVTYNQEYVITIDTNSSEYIQIEKQKAIEGEQVEFTVLERDGYRIDEVKYNDTTLQSENNTYLFNMLAGDVTIVVTYIQQFEVILQSDMENADLSGADTYDIGSEITITASTNIEDQEGNQYRLIGWQHNEEFIPAEEGGIYTFTLTAETAGTYTAIYESGYKVEVEEKSAQYIQIDKGVGYENDTIAFIATIEDEVSDTQVIERALKITKADGQEVEFTNQDNQYSFTMPAGDVTIAVNTNTLNRITDFQINGNTISKYLGTDSNVTIPSSYYPYIQENDGTLEFNSYDEFNNYMQEELAQYQIGAGYFTYSLNGTDYSNKVKDVQAWLTEIQAHSQDEQFNLKIKLPTEYMVTEEDAIELGDMLLYSTVAPFFQLAMASEILSFTYQTGENEPVNVDASNVWDILESIDPESMVPIKFTNIKYGKTYLCVGEGQEINVIGEDAFSVCDSLTSITIQEGATLINRNAFYNCSNLTKVVLPSSLTTIGDYAFSSCTNLTEITLPTSLTSIGSSAFDGCSNLPEVTLPSTLIYIGDSAFDGCNNLQYNEYKNGRYLGNDENPYVALISVKDQSVATFNIHENCKIIYASAFESCNNLQYNEYKNGRYLGNDKNPYVALISVKDQSVATFNIHENCKIINDHAFYRCTKLTSITIPEGVTSIGDYAFYDCDSLTSITLPSSLTSIGAVVFNFCDSLTSITLPSSLTFIGSDAFFYASLTEVVIESDDIYKAAKGTGREHASSLLENATTVKVLTSIVNTCDNSYLENEANFTTSIEGEYTVFTRVS